MIERLLLGVLVVLVAVETFFVYSTYTTVQAHAAKITAVEARIEQEVSKVRGELEVRAKRVEDAAEARVKRVEDEVGRLRR